MLLCSLSVLLISDSASKGSQSTILDDSNKPVELSEQSVDHLQLTISYCWMIPAILFIKYLFIDTYRGTSYHLGLESVSLDLGPLCYAPLKSIGHGFSFLSNIFKLKLTHWIIIILTSFGYLTFFS